MKLLDIVRQVKVRIRRPPKARRQLPTLTWEQINKDAEAELLEQAQEEAEEVLSELEQSLRNPN